ncbi:hypothetical protein TURU_081880 [Turdus rufiventris]|nr:hypothetical protein TURU_081880 [Turdus rufiventris]
MVSDLLHHLNIHKSMELDGIHPRILRELAKVLTKPLSIIYQQSWQTRKGPSDRKFANMMPTSTRSIETTRPVSLTLVLGEVMEQVLLSAIMWHVQGKEMIRPSQHGFMKGKSCLTNLVSFYDSDPLSA